MNIDTAHTALLVIDAIDADDSVYKSDPAQDDYRKKVASVVDTCHQAKIPVIYCCDAHIKGLDKELDLWGDHGLKDQTHLFPEIKQASSDFYIAKRRYSAFFETDLDLTLRELGVTTVIAVGADTNICVLHTLADAFYRNYASIVVGDATFTSLCGTQEDAFEHFKKCFGSAIVSVSELRTALQ